MAQRHVFGKTLTFKFIPQAYDEDVAPYSLTSARIFLNYPTQAQIETPATTGYIEAVTSWTQVSGAEYSISFAALTDSTPHSDVDYVKYYVVVNFKWQVGGSDVFVVEQILVYRPDALTSKIRLAYTDITAIESKINDLLTPTVIGYKIDLAIEEIDKRLRARGYEKKYTFNREDLNFAAKHLATCYCCADLAGEGNQFWWDKAKYYEDKANMILNQTAVNYDIDQSGLPEPTQYTNSGGAVYLSR